MSWVQVVLSQLNEDVFDENVDEMDLLQKEWKNTMEKRIKEGYTDGAEAGKVIALQQGFNQGYKQGAEMMMPCGQLRGTLNALLSWCHFNEADSTVLSKINNLLDAVAKYEKHLHKQLNSLHQQPHLGDLLHSVEDMDISPALPTEEQFDESTIDKLCENDAGFNEKCCRNSSEVDSTKAEYCRRTKKQEDSEKPTLTLIKEHTVSLLEQLGLTLDMLQHIQELEG
uniref:YAE1 maturation factor of ABCE1 n=1 Tax=Sphenodon punctatus TaxID=8508 RepID=A0A8D0HFC5_SPHPU